MKKNKVKLTIRIEDAELEREIRDFLSKEGFGLVDRFYINGKHTYLSFEETSKRARERFSKRYRVDNIVMDDVIDD